MGPLNIAKSFLMKEDEGHLSKEEKRFSEEIRDFEKTLMGKEFGVGSENLSKKNYSSSDWVRNLTHN